MINLPYYYYYYYYYYFRINNVLQLNFFVSVLFLGIAAGSLRSVNSYEAVKKRRVANKASAKTHFKSSGEII